MMSPPLPQPINKYIDWCNMLPKFSSKALLVPNSNTVCVKAIRHEGVQVELCNPSQPPIHTLNLQLDPRSRFNSSHCVFSNVWPANQWPYTHIRLPYVWWILWAIQLWDKMKKQTTYCWYYKLLITGLLCSQLYSGKSAQYKIICIARQFSNCCFLIGNMWWLVIYTRAFSPEDRKRLCLLPFGGPCLALQLPVFPRLLCVASPLYTFYTVFPSYSTLMCHVILKFLFLHAFAHFQTIRNHSG